VTRGGRGAARWRWLVSQLLTAGRSPHSGRTRGPGSDGAPAWAQGAQVLLQTRQRAEGGGCRRERPGLAVVAWLRALPGARCAQGRSAAPRAACQFGAVLLDQGVGRGARAGGSGPPIAVDWPARPSGRPGRRSCLGLVWGGTDARMQAAQPGGRSPYGAASSRGLAWSENRGAGRVVVNGGNAIDREGRVRRTNQR